MEQSRRKVQTPSINKQKQHLFLGQKPSKQTLLKRLPDYYNAITIRNKNIRVLTLGRRRKTVVRP